MEIIKHYKAEVSKGFTQFQQEYNQSKEEHQPAIQSPLVQQINSNEPNKDHSSLQLQTNPYKVTKRPQKFSSSESSCSKKCIVCRKPSSYRCPQCLIAYCSLPHYKSHNLFCSEEFYKRNVEQEMKSLRAGKRQNEEMRDLLKEHREELGRIDGLEARRQGLSEERLLEVLKVIQEKEEKGQEVQEGELKLTEEEMLLFTQYINQLQLETPVHGNGHNDSENSVPHGTNFTSEPFWLIPDGLDHYFMQQLQIQQFSQSQHMPLILQRELLAKRFRQDIKSMAQLLPNKEPSKHLREDVLQYMVAYVLTVMSYGGDVKEEQLRLEIFEILDEVVIDNLAKNLTQMNLNDNEASSYTFGRLRENIANIKSNQTSALIQSWYQSSLISSLKIIVKNRYLLIQTLFRLLTLLQSLLQKFKDHKTKEQKLFNKRLTKHEKKLWFLLSYVKQHMTQSNASNKQTLWRHLYRAIMSQENTLNQITKTKQQIQQVKNDQTQLQKHGIIIS